MSNNIDIPNNFYLPHNFLAEKIILSHLVVNAQSADTILRSLPVEAFYFKNHQIVYEAIRQLYKTNSSINLLLLLTFLKDNGLLEKIGGIKVLNNCIVEIPQSTNLNDYIQLIYEKFLRRNIIKLGYQAINSAYITNIPLEKVISNLEFQIFNLTNNTNQSKLKTSAELLHNVFLDLKQKTITNSSSGLLTGFTDLDLMTQGLQNSDLIIVAGRPSMGKTAFSLQIALNIVKSTELPVIFFSLEMSKEQLTYRLLGNQTEINHQKLKTASLSKQNWQQIIKCIRTFSYFPFFIDDTPNLKLTDLRSKIRKIVFEQNKIGLIVIDYLQLMEISLENGESRVQELSQITRSLKTIAREFDIPVIALSQLSRNVESRVNKRPILSDLRESGSIEQDADIVLMLYRDNYYNSIPTSESTAEVIIAKHRNGPTGTISLDFNPQLTKFTDFEG